MKKIAIICFIALVGVSVHAQKIAHLNVAKLVSEMPEKIQVDEKLKAEADTKGKELKATQDALELKFKNFQDKVSKLTEAQIKTQKTALEKEQADLQAEGKRFDDNRAVVSKEIQKKSDDMYKPIFEKAQLAIDKVALAKGFDYVIDASAQVLVYAKGYDMYDDVKKELGIK